MKMIEVLPTLCCGPDTAPLEPAERAALAARFKALSDPTRVAIVNRLAAADEVCVCDFVASLAVGQPTVSHHLKVLREAGLVESSRRGTWAYYRLVPEAVGALRSALGGYPALISATPASAIATPAS